jgi:hypothetical protein
MTTATLPELMTDDILVTSNGMLQSQGLDPATLDAACRLISRAADGKFGLWAYQAFDYMNSTFFDGELPTPFILWTVTEWGGCLGNTQPSNPAIIRLHPGLLGGQKIGPGENWQTKKVWNIPLQFLGLAMAYDTLLHECMHISVEHRLGGTRGKTSHNNPQWIGEVNRIAPMLGLDITAAPSKPMRVPIEGQFTKTGKPATRVKRGTEGTVPFKAVSTFPYLVRIHLGLTTWYTDKRLPFPHVFDQASQEHTDA